MHEEQPHTRILVSGHGAQGSEEDDASTWMAAGSLRAATGVAALQSRTDDGRPGRQDLGPRAGSGADPSGALARGWTGHRRGALTVPDQARRGDTRQGLARL